MTKESQMFISAVQHEIEMLRLLSGIERKAGHTQSTWQVIRDVAARLEVAALAAQSAAPVGEQVAWTNEAQLGYLRDKNLSEIPMAMWAKPIGAADIPLYRAALAKPGDS